MKNQQSNESGVPLEIHDLTVAYDSRPVLYGIDLTLQSGQLVGVMGPNGAGKSTLLKAVMGFLQPSGGWVRIFGKPVREGLRHVGYVPQRESVDWDFPVTVMDVVLMGCYGRLGWWQRPGRKEKGQACSCLERVDMLRYANRPIANLSGGQQQRVFIARALMQEADIYLMDEPFSGVDAATERALVTLLQEMRAQGRTIVVVHHDLPTAREYFDTLVLLNMRLIAYGPVAEVFTPHYLQKAYGGRLTILSEVAAVVGGKDE